MYDCIDDNIGKMLHAYELQTLTDEERDIFEQHLLVCDYCHDKARAFLPSAVEILESEELSIFAERAATSWETKREQKSLRDLLWPRTPFLFRPAISYALLAIAIILGLWFIDAGKRERDIVKPLQSISLVPLRNSQQPDIKISDGTDALFQFYVPGGDDNQVYRIQILRGDNTVIYENQEFRLNAENRGLFYLDLRSLDTGIYTLSLSYDFSDTNIVVYYFNIVE